MKKTAPLLLSLSVACATAFGAEPDLSELPPPAAQKGVTYTKDVRAIFEASCFRCHGSERQKGGLRLDSLEAALKGGEDGKVIVPGKSVESALVHAVARLDEEKAMPPKPKPGGPGRPGGPGGQGNRPPSPGGQGGPANRPPGAPTGPGGPGGGFTPAKPLSPQQVGLIRAWIDQGAK